MSFFLLLSLQWAVCDRQTLYRQEYRHRICGQVHQEAAESGQQAWRAERGDRAGGGHPAADHAPQHRRAARRVWEPHRCGAHPRTVSHCSTPQHLHRGCIIVSVWHSGGLKYWTLYSTTFSYNYIFPYQFSRHLKEVYDISRCPDVLILNVLCNLTILNYVKVIVWKCIVAKLISVIGM